MSKTKKALLPVRKAKDKFVLDLNTAVYKDELIRKAVDEDKDWIKKMPSSDRKYVRLQLKTSDLTDVLHWTNYLIYLHRG